MKKFFTFLMTLFTFTAFSQTVSTFEEFALLPGEFLNDSDVGFDSGNISLESNYNSDYDFWTDWAISATTDNQTPGLPNQYSSMAGGGQGQSTGYAVCYSTSKIILKNDAIGGQLQGMFVTNNAYAYYSMLSGDSFAKKFGGETGDDPDYFYISIQKYEEGELSQDAIDFYLADYRFNDNSLDYIVDEWTFVDLSSLGNVDSLKITFFSSDSGDFGPNTPTYFCMDNFVTLDMPVSNEEIESPLAIALYPNPSSDFVFFDWSKSKNATAAIYDMSGRIVQNTIVQTGQNQIDIKDLNNGIYILKMEGQSIGTKFIKR